MCICVWYMRTQVCPGTLAHGEARSWVSVLVTSLPCFAKQGLPLNLELALPTRVSGQCVLGQQALRALSPEIAL